MSDQQSSSGTREELANALENWAFWGELDAYLKDDFLDDVERVYARTPDVAQAPKLADLLAAERQRRVAEIHNDSLVDYLAGFDDATDAVLSASTVSSTYRGDGK